MVLEAPLVVTFCADWFRTREWLRQRDAADNFANFMGFHVAAYDAMIVAQNACLGFEDAGLGICYMGTTLFELRAISEFLGLPETCVPVTTIVVGYPNEDPPKRDRLRPSETDSRSEDGSTTKPIACRARARSTMSLKSASVVGGNATWPIRG